MTPLQLKIGFRFVLQLLVAVSVNSILGNSYSINSFADDRNNSDKWEKEFEERVAPLFIKRCIECHNPLDRSGGLDLTSAKGFKSGGDSEEDLADSNRASNLLLDRVNSGEMPPEEKGHSRELKAEEKLALARWISAGSKWPDKRVLDLYEFTSEVRGGRDWWSFQPIKRPAVPKLFGLQNPVDALVHSKHIKRKLEFSPDASRRVLYRRICFDVTGLPPDIGDIQSFEKDPSPNAYEKLVDRFLASPRFGEHLGRDWLDLVRYADTNGYERDAEKPNSWKYRDWVIESINADKPFNLFVMQQLAGDQIHPLSENNVIGTTMLRVGTWDDEPNDKLEYKYDRLEDLIHVTSTAFLGLTVKCARCHNHKFDPIPQVDYYRFGSIFWPGDLMGNKSDQVKSFSVYSWSDVNSKVEPIRLLKKGNPRQPLEKLEPGFPSVFGQLDSRFQEPEHPGQDTGRRLEFAKRLVDNRNPLVARVIVNRIWQHYFGQGIVRTPNNFGYKGDLPTHPELLDWLASELIANEWNLKPIHKLILTSRTYRQSSGHRLANKPHSRAIEFDRNSLDADPLNLYLSRMNRKRLTAESIRDSILSHSGELNLHMGGRGFIPDVSEEALEGLSKRSNAWQPSSMTQQSRRGIYLFVKRSLIPPLISTFDFADSTRPCGKRDLTIVAPQALALLNNRFVNRQSEQFAKRIMDRTSNPVEQIHAAWQKALGRAPSKKEMSWAYDHYRSQLKEFSRDGNPTTFNEKSKSEPKGRLPNRSFSVDNLVIHLDANFNVETDEENHVIRWTDRHEKHFAAQKEITRAPILVKNKIDGKSVIEFDGIGQFLEFNDQLIKSKNHTIVLVGHDENKKGHREFFSNWNSNGNSTSSVFLGLTDGRVVRFSDQFRSRTSVPKHPFVLSAVTGESDARVYSGHRLIAKRSAGLSGRKLNTKYVLGTQGNYGHEYLKGWIAELLVYDRALSDRELRQLITYLEKKFPSAKTKDLGEGEGREMTEEKRTPEWLALASICHVLLNSNENIFVD